MQPRSKQYPFRPRVHLPHISVHIPGPDHPRRENASTACRTQLVPPPEMTLEPLVTHLALSRVVLHQQHVVIDFAQHKIHTWIENKTRVEGRDSPGWNARVVLLPIQP